MRNIIKKIYFWVVSKFKNRMSQEAIYKEVKNVLVSKLFDDIELAFVDERNFDLDNLGIRGLFLKQNSGSETTMRFFEFSNKKYRLKTEIFSSTNSLYLSTDQLIVDEINEIPKNTFQKIKELDFIFNAEKTLDTFYNEHIKLTVDFPEQHKSINVKRFGLYYVKLFWEEIKRREQAAVEKIKHTK